MSSTSHTSEVRLVRAPRPGFVLPQASTAMKRYLHSFAGAAKLCKRGGRRRDRGDASTPRAIRADDGEGAQESLHRGSARPGVRRRELWSRRLGSRERPHSRTRRPPGCCRTCRADGTARTRRQARSHWRTRDGKSNRSRVSHNSLDGTRSPGGNGARGDYIVPFGDGPVDGRCGRVGRWRHRSARCAAVVIPVDH